MAIMIDCGTNKLNTNKNTDLRNYIKDSLPDNIICYCNVENNNINYCLSIGDVGLFIIEERDWKVENISSVSATGDINLIDETGEIYTDVSPAWKAKAYQFELSITLKNRYNINPPIYLLVCYPNLTQQEYQSKEMEMISEPGITIFKEEINNLKDRIYSVHKEFHKSEFYKFDEKITKICRNHFVGKEFFNNNEIEIIYSILKVCDSEISKEDIDELISKYVSGTKIVLFVQNNDDVERIAKSLSLHLNSIGRKAEKGNIIIKNNPENNIEVLDNHFNIFNFEVFGLEDFKLNSDLCVVNGIINDSDYLILKSLSEKTNFNLQQYLIEHAPVGKDICVRAGAGTGKTYSMVSRIAFLTLNNHKSEVYKPEEDIAMLTFTKKAACNMKNRLKNNFMNYFSLTGSSKYLEYISSIEKMQISTIHSFARKVIEKTSVPIGIGSEFKTASGIYERRSIFNRNFNEFLKQKNSNNPYFIYQLPMSVDILQKKFLQISEMLYERGTDIKDLTIDCFGKAPEELSYLNDIIENVIIKTEREYSKKLIDNNCIKLNEYMLFLKKIVNSESFNSNFYKFKYLFVDEFQDTDEAQISAFLDMQRKLNFNLFIVGDLKQSIYRFRGSSMDAFQNMGCSNDNWLNFSLYINYRTDKRVLEIYDKRFIEWGSKKIYNERTLLPFVNGRDNLIGVKINSAYSNPVMHLEYENEEDADKLFISAINEEIKKIRSLMEKQKLSLNDRTIAVLVRANDEIRKIIKLADANGITIETDAVGDLYRLQPSVDLCKLTSALCNPYNITYLFDLINSNYIKAKYTDFYNLKEKSDEEKLGILIEFLDNFIQERMGRSWNQLISEVQTRPVLMMLRIIYEKLQPWNNYSSDENDRLFYRNNYDLVFEKLSDDENEYYITLESINESLHINIETGTNEESKSLLSDESDIKIICQTVHKAKGLEYGTVIMPYMERSLGSIKKDAVYVSVDDNKIGYLLTYNFKEYQNENFDIDQEILENRMEESRILYVAMTRAINNFIYLTPVRSNPDTWAGIIGDLP